VRAETLIVPVRQCCVSLLLLLACCRVDEGANGFPRPLRIDDPATYWPKTGFAEMVPPVYLPTSMDERDRIRVWIRVPDDGRIEVERPRGVLRFPPGTVADRVESSCREDSDDEGCRVMDVRGTTFAAGGAEQFHVYQPDPDAQEARMLGWEWRRGHSDEARTAGSELVKLLRPSESARQWAASVQRFNRLNDCEGCHGHDQPEARGATARPRRATDASGLYVPQTVLADGAPAETHRPRDRNVSQPFLAVACGSGPAILRDGAGGARHWICADGRVPIVTLALRAALAADDPHARAVCRSRQYLFDHMSTDARRAFAPAFEACAISAPSAHAAAR
jgi:hypothetical protein